MDKRHTLLGTWFKDKNGKLVIMQAPNVYIVVWFTATVVALLLSGRWQIAVHVVAVIALIIWAWLEITQGVNYFRKVLGVIVLAATVSTLLM